MVLLCGLGHIGVATGDAQDSNRNANKKPPSFRSINPVGCRIYDAQTDKAIIYVIDDGEEEGEITIEWSNQSENEIRFADIDTKPDGDNYHFQLIFRPGTFERLAGTQNQNQAILAIVDGSKKLWELGDQAVNSDGNVSVFVRYKNTQSLWHANQSRKLTLRYASAHRGSGERVSHVEVRFGKLGINGSDVTLSGLSRRQKISILNQRNPALPVTVPRTDKPKVLPSSTRGDVR